jgi:hypothetical protein
MDRSAIVNLQEQRFWRMLELGYFAQIQRRMARGSKNHSTAG